MAKMDIPKKIRVEDFKSEDQEMVSKIAWLVNSFFDSTYNILNKNIDFDNLNRQLVDVTVSIDSTGKVINSPQIKFNLKNNKVRGVSCVNAVNTKAPNTYPSNTPFISWTLNNGILTVLAVTGLQNSSEYKLTLELIG